MKTRSYKVPERGDKLRGFDKKNKNLTDFRLLIDSPRYLANREVMPSNFSGKVLNLQS